MDKKIIISSLAMDLKRVALGLHNGSLATARRFRDEALKRISELEQQEVEEYLKRLLPQIKDTLKSEDQKSAEDSLMYSTLTQNYCIKKF